MGRPLLWLLLAPWTLPGAEPEARAESFVRLAQVAPADGWVSRRASTLVADKLRSLGVQVRRGGSEEEGVYQLEARPGDTQDPAAALTLNWSQRKSGKLESGRESGDAATLELMAARIAVQWAERAGLKVAPEEAYWLAQREAPFSVHALIGAGLAQQEAGDLRRAFMKLEQASTSGGEFFPEAQRLARSAKHELTGSSEARLLSERELATSALARARGAGAQGRLEEAAVGYRAYASYEPRASRPADVSAGVHAERHALHVGERWCHVETGVGRAFSLDEGSFEFQELQSRAPLLALFEGDVVRLERGSRLVRAGAKGKPRFSLTLPAQTSVHERLGLPVVRGFGALVGGPKLSWVDLGLGTASTTFEGRVLAVGDEGVLAWRGAATGGRLVFFRPGRHQASFEVELEEAPSSASLTRGRVMIELSGQLYLHDSESGRRRAGPFPVGGGVVHLGSHGRYGAFGQADGRILMLDVLAGEPLGTLEGPGPAVAALGHEHGLALVFASGDLLYVDREGAVADRAQVPGLPLGAAWVGPGDKSILVLSTQGLYFASPPNPDAPRDVDVYLELAELYARAGRKDAALRLATHGARMGAGRIAAFEGLRARLLEGEVDPARQAARTAALLRAEAAQNSKTRLLPFAWVKAR